jgi:NAD(P)-dependent dehydrogenase (short-subunit alcohol dehydrogenase family)
MNELFSVKEKVVIITGGYGILGRSVTKYLASQGAQMIILGRRPEKGSALVDELKKEGYMAYFMQADATDEVSLKKCREDIVNKFGRIDVLINAAGGNKPGAVIQPSQYTFDLNLDDLKDVVDLNLYGTVIPTMIFGEEMAKVKKGVILNFSSMASFRPMTRVVGYSAAKAAINSFTEFMAGELAIKFGEGLRVNAIAPGFFLTEQNKNLMTNPDGSWSDRAQAVMAHTPFHRLGKAEEINGTIQYLISDASSFITGTVVAVDGGFNAFAI